MAFEYTFRGADMPELEPKVRDLLENRDQELELYLSSLGGSGSSPSGSLTAFAGATAPTGWLICDGSVVSQTTYASLYAVVGSTYNTGGEGAGNFRLPNMKGRVIVGRDASDSDFNVLGETGGAKTHTLTTTEMPSHIHTGTAQLNGAHFHNYQDHPRNPAIQSSPGSGIQDRSAVSANTGSAGDHSHLLSIDAAGSGGAHNNLQPYIALNWIIKT
jgi:microcystin-dependent protein